MFDFNNFKSKVMDSINKAADTTKDLADKAADKAKDVSRVAKLTLEINSEKDVIRKAYSEIGKLYYETHKDSPEGFFIQLCDEVTLAQENIAAKESEISDLKTSSSDDDDDSITVEFEEVVSYDEPAEDIAEAVADVAEEISEAVADVAEKISDAVEDVVEDAEYGDCGDDCRKSSDGESDDPDDQ